jgi:hypothetical protein
LRGGAKVQKSSVPSARPPFRASIDLVKSTDMTVASEPLFNRISRLKCRVRFVGRRCRLGHTKLECRNSGRSRSRSRQFNVGHPSRMCDMGSLDAATEISVFMKLKLANCASAGDTYLRVFGP